MKKNICLIATALFIAAASLFSVSCSKEFQVEESQLKGKWVFPADMAPDTVTGFNWANAIMTISTDTIRVSNEPGKVYLWTLRGNSVTAICQPRPTVDESWIIAFTVYEATADKLKINGKYRYVYHGDNTVRGDISCTLKKYVPTK